MKYFLLFLLLLLCCGLSSSCDNIRNEVLVKNESSQSIDSLLFKNSSECLPLKFSNIAEQTSQIKVFDNCSKAIFEGNVIITTYVNGKKQSIGHGYYTAGGTYFKKISITIDKNGKLNIVEKY